MNDLDPRVERLPKWAQVEMRKLKVAADSADARVERAYRMAEDYRLETNPDGQRIVLHQNLMGGDIGVDDRTKVRFYLKPRDEMLGFRCEYVDVSLSHNYPGRIELMGGTGVTVTPQASNVVHVGIEPR